MIDLLQEAPSRIAALTADASPRRLRARTGRDVWSANDVLAHMRSCADMWGGAIEKIVAGEPTLRAVNPRQWIKSTDYLELEFGPSFRAYARQRARLVSALRALPPRAWSRAATVTGAGAPLRRTVLLYAQKLVLHERPHLEQIERLVDQV